LFVDVPYFDPYLKRVRIENADPDTLGFVPQWYGERVLEHAEQNGARISMRGVTAPHMMDGLDKSQLGKDMLPSVKEKFKVVSERSTNWCFLPAPHPAWAALVHPDLPAERGGVHEAGLPPREWARHRDEAARPKRRDDHP
jgi:aminopeptidase